MNTFVVPSVQDGSSLPCCLVLNCTPTAMGTNHSVDPVQQGIRSDACSFSARVLNAAGGLRVECLVVCRDDQHGCDAPLAHLACFGPGAAAGRWLIVAESKSNASRNAGQAKFGLLLDSSASSSTGAMRKCMSQKPYRLSHCRRMQQREPAHSGAAACLGGGRVVL